MNVVVREYRAAERGAECRFGSGDECPAEVRGAALRGTLLPALSDRPFVAPMEEIVHRQGDQLTGDWEMILSVDDRQ